MIGIIGAMKIEVEGFNAEMQNPVCETFSGITYTRGTLCGKEVVTAVCGVGKVFAAVCAQTMALKYSPSLIINTGVGGSLSPELSVGDVAVASSVVQHDMDTTALGDEKGLLSGINMVNLPCDVNAVQAMKNSLSSLGIHCISGVIASGDQFISSNDAKKRIVSEFNAVVCEMEGASIGHVCYINKTPFIVVRAVSDSADGGAVEDFPKFAKESSEKSIKAVKKFLELY